MTRTVTPSPSPLPPVSNFFLVLSDFWYYIFILLLKSRALLCRIIVQLYTFLFLCSPSQCLLNLYYFIFILCLFLFISKFFIFSDLFLFILSIFFERWFAYRIHILSLSSFVKFIYLRLLHFSLSLPYLFISLLLCCLWSLACASGRA